MDHDPNPELRAELDAALAAIDPQIRGLRDLLELDIASAAVHDTYQAEFDILSQRRTLIAHVLAALDSVVAAMDALEADGYPNIAQVPVDAAIFDEMSGEISDMEAAFKLFAARLAASKLAVNLGEPKPKS